jgi:hypothetical protein
MKIIIRLLVCALTLYFAASETSAQTLAKDDAAAYNALGNTWTNGMNLGYGFGPWTLLSYRDNEVNAYAGFFIGDGDGIATANNSAWGLYANGATTNYNIANAAVAFRAFTNALPVNGLFKIKLRNAGIGGDVNPPYHLGGFALRNGNATNTVDDYQTGARLVFYYIGGVDDNFRVIDGGPESPYATGLGFGAAPFQVDLILLSADTYRLIIKNAAGTSVLTNFTGTLAGSGTIDSVSLYNFQCDGNQVFNSMEISTTSLIPPDIQNVQPTNNSAYVASSSAITFDVISEFSGVSSGNIALTLNGTNVTGLSFSGSTTNWSVTKSGALVANATYNGSIVVTDLNGNKATNNFNFNTWRSDNFFIEAEDYNFNGGGFIANYFPNGYTNLLGVNGIDYLDSLTNGTSIYRTNDVPATEYAGDSLDHNDFLLNGYVDFNLAYVQWGEWENYTRRLSNTTYTVYARMTGAGNNPVMLMERLANPTATTSNQPLAALGTFVAPNTFDIVSNYTFVPLKDFFSSNVLVRFSRATAGTTNTLRLTRIGDGYNLNYLIFVPTSITSTQRPYLSAGFPYPGAANIEPDQTLSFTIANRETMVTPGTIQLYVNNANVSGSITTSNNNAGCVVTYVPTSYYPSGGTSTVSVVYTDSGSVTQTNTWQFTVANVTVIPPAYALASGSGLNRGFNVRVAKATNSATLALLPLTAARVDSHLANLIIDPNTSLPFYNEAGGPGGDGRYAEINTINYNQVIEFGSSGITNDALFPYVAPTLTGSYTNDPNFISLEAIAYAQLNPGIYKWAVRSDDGFQLAFGTGTNPTNLIVGNFDGGRGDGTPSEFEFIVQTAGLYPFRLVYYEGDGFATCELYSINRNNGEVVLINDPANVAAVATYRNAPVVILNPKHTGNTTTFNFVTQAGRTHTIEYKNALTNGPWVPLQTITGNGATTNITDATASGPRRFYRVNTQ